ncbi:MAG: hypothetical protein KAU03_06810, partial [Candidatus Altiarchaeales archaeon]|nr:hypothetical protein [Candidatus Altiarchaeales archaeon]
MLSETGTLDGRAGMRVKRSDGSIGKFDPDQIISRCMHAGASSSVASKVASFVAENIYDGISTKEIGSMVYNRLKEINPALANQYKYRLELRVRTSQTVLGKFDRKKIIESLIEETQIDEEVASEVSLAVEKELERLRLDYDTAPLIREIVNVKLLEKGMESARARYTRLGMPVYDVKNLMKNS